MTPAIRLLESARVDFGLHEYERGDERREFGREAADRLGLDPDQVFKTLLLDVNGDATSTDPVVVIVPVSCSVSMKAVATAAGAKRATMCEPARAERITGYVVGGISPFGQRKRLRTVVDDSATLFEVVYVSGGRRGLDVSVAPSTFVELLGATFADVTA